MSPYTALSGTTVFTLHSRKPWLREGKQLARDRIYLISYPTLCLSWGLNLLIGWPVGHVHWCELESALWLLRHLCTCGF